MTPLQGCPTAIVLTVPCEISRALCGYSEIPHWNAPPHTHKVCRAFEGTITNAASQNGSVSLLAAKQSLNLRHRSWFKRKAEDSAGAWRPAKRHRAASRAWVMNVDNQIRHSTGLQGFIDFVRPASPCDRWAPATWRRWRHVQISVDQGSDALCSTAFLKHLLTNVSVLCDWGANNDFLDTVRDHKVFGWWLLMLILFNVEHGPFAEDLRWNQVEEAWRECRPFYDAKSSVLFQEYSAAIIEDLSSDDRLELGSGQDPEEAAWAFMDDDPVQHPKGSKTQLSRYQAARRKAKEMVSTWSMKRMQYECCCIELDMFPASTVQQLQVRAPPDVRRKYVVVGGAWR